MRQNILYYSCETDQDKLKLFWSDAIGKKHNIRLIFANLYLYNFTLFEVFWLVHVHGGTTEEGNCSYLLPLSHRDVADKRRPLRKSIDYLLKVVSGWQRISNPCLPAIFYSLLTRFNQAVILVYKGLSAYDGSLGNIMNDYKGAVLDWWYCSSSQWAEIILCLGGANERRRYIKTSSVVVWAHVRGGPWCIAT